MNVGLEPDVALAAKSRKESELRFIAEGGEIKDVQGGSETRIKVAEAIKEYLEDCRDHEGNPDTDSRQQQSKHIASDVRFAGSLRQSADGSR